MNTPINVLVVEDQAVVREGIIAILSFYADIKVVDEAENGIEAVKLVRQLKPDVVLLDLNMPRQNGLETIPQILKFAPNTHILVLTGFDEADNIYNAVKLGASGYLLKDSSKDQLVNAIHDVHRGEGVIPPSIALRMIREMSDTSYSPNKQHSLTNRELETLQFIARGFSNQKIAQELGVHERTISKYVSSILSKLHLENRTQAALYALRTGIMELNEE